MARRLWPLWAVLVFAVPPGRTEEEVRDYKIDHRGSLHDVLDKGDLRWQIALGDLRGRRHLYALGVLAHPGGEIIVWNSVPIVTTVRDGKAKTRITWDRDAACLAWTQVEEWHPVPVPATVQSLRDLAAFVPRAAAGFMLDTTRPIPFRLEGTFGVLATHVMSPVENGGGERVTPASAGFRVQAVQAEIFGIYSDRSRDYIPRGGSLFLQVKSKDGQIMGRVDAIEKPRGAILYLPR